MLRLPHPIGCRCLNRQNNRMDRPRLEITNHAIRRWQQRIERVPEPQALAGMLMALQTADDRHFKEAKLAKKTFYIPTERAIFVGCKGRIVTVLSRGQSPYAATKLSTFEQDLEAALIAKNPHVASVTNPAADGDA